jgi:hypothetical protein
MSRTREGKPALGQRLKSAFLKPEDPEAPPRKSGTEVPTRSVEELEVAAKSADDKERLIGLFAAPFAAIIGILVITDLIDHDPRTGRLHVSISLYHELTLVLLGLAVVMLATAWFRKRLYLAITMALYGLAIFNLHYWGFGVPYVFVGAWLMVRSYRLQRDLREATGGKQSRASRSATGAGPLPSKRYTPPTSRTKSAS